MALIPCNFPKRRNNTSTERAYSLKQLEISCYRTSFKVPLFRDQIPFINAECGSIFILAWRNKWFFLSKTILWKNRLNTTSLYKEGWSSYLRKLRLSVWFPSLVTVAARYLEIPAQCLDLQACSITKTKIQTWILFNGGNAISRFELRKSSVVDQDWFQCGSEHNIFKSMRIRIQFRIRILV